MRFCKAKRIMCPVHRLQTGQTGSAKFSRIYRSKRLDDLLQVIEDAVVYQVDGQGHSKIILDPAQLEHYLEDSIHATDDIGQTVLHLAVMWCDAPVVERLLEVGLKADQADSSGMCPVHCCALFGYQPVFQLMPHETWAITQEDSGKSALHFAAMSGNLEVVKYIVQSGDDIDVQDKYGHTPTAIASLYSQPDCVELLVENGARTDIRDKSCFPVFGVVNAKYQSIAARMLDKYVEKDTYNGIYNVDLSFVLSKCDKESNTTPGIQSLSGYVGMVALSKNIASHITVRCLTDLKWNKYGRRIFYSRFFVFLSFNLYWTLIYAFPTEQLSGDFSGRKGLGYCIMVFSILVLIASAGFISYEMIRNKHKMTKLQRMVVSRFTFERTTQNHLTSPFFLELSKFYGRLSRTTLNTWKSQVGNVVLIVLHLALLIQGILKPLNFINDIDTSKSPTYIGISLVNSVVLLGLWVRIFYECQVHKSIGRFVIFTQEVLGDVCLVGSVFFFMYIPNLAIFYYTVYRYDDSIDWYDIPFYVLRMAVIDYDYDHGKELAESENIGWWWNVYSILWLMFTACVILNLFIALMSDRYATLGSRAKNIMALARAEFIANIDTLMSAETVEKINDEIFEADVISHVPTQVEDTEKDELIEKRMDRLEEKIDSLTKMIGNMKQVESNNLR